jgi:hypothetical protein
MCFLWRKRLGVWWLDGWGNRAELQRLGPAKDGEWKITEGF